MGEDFPPDFRLLSEIQQKPYFHPCRFQVIHQLQLMFFLQHTDSFQFQDNRIVHDYICNIIAYQFPFIINLYRLLCHTRDIPPQQFLIKGVLIDLLQKSIAKFVIDIIECAQDVSCL